MEVCKPDWLVRGPRRSVLIARFTFPSPHVSRAAHSLSHGATLSHSKTATKLGMRDMQ
jgi:hypothetical protein